MIYTVVDVESTGLRCNLPVGSSGDLSEYQYLDDIVSFGFIRINSNFDILASGNLYFYNENFKNSEDGAFSVHGISTEFLKQYENQFYDNIKKMYSLCYMSTLIGKNNNKFDNNIIKNFITKYCYSVPPLVIDKTFDLQKVVGPMYRKWTGSKSPGKLSDYLDLFKISQDRLMNVYKSLPDKDDNFMHMHGSLWDCVATLEVFKEYTKMWGVQI